MKKIFGFVVLSALVFTAFSQVMPSHKPVNLSSPDILLPAPENIPLPFFNLLEAQQADRIDELQGLAPVFSRSLLTDITPGNSGRWSEMPGGDRVWRVQITSAGALGLLPYFDKFYLPPGAMLFVYAPDYRQVIGAFTASNNPNGGPYATGLVYGESCLLEYYEPLAVRGKGILHLNEVGHAYRMISNYENRRSEDISRSLGFNTSQSCEVNVNCDEGLAWQNQKRSVVCIIIKSGHNQLFCSGAMVNNMRQDCTPYLLSAQHCTYNADPEDYAQWLFYFNYESPVCSNPDSVRTLDDSFITGCTKKANSNDGGGITGSDFLLLQLNQAPPANFNVFYAGWNRANSPPASGVFIHHPTADIKKISTYARVLTDTTWGGQVSHTHWLVFWSPTANGFGISESASSGGPLFNNLGQITGTLTGGSPNLSCANPYSADYFGKIAFDWTGNGTSPDLQLKPWLDPDNTGVFSLNGKTMGCPVGLNELPNEEIEIKVMPNPSAGKFDILFSTAEEKSIRLFDASGRIIREGRFSEKNFNLDLSSAPGGIYILQTETKSSRSWSRLFIAKD